MYKQVTAYKQAWRRKARRLSTGQCVRIIARETGVRQGVCESVLRGWRALILRHLRTGGEIDLAGVGILSQSVTPGRVLYGLRGTIYDVPPAVGVSFSISRAMRRDLNPRRRKAKVLTAAQAQAKQRLAG